MTNSFKFKNERLKIRDMIKEIRNIKSEKKHLRQFGLVMGGVLAVVGVILFLRHKDFYYYFFILSAIFVSFAVIIPVVLKPIQKLWMSFGIVMNYLVIRAVLTILFYLIMTFIGVVSRLLGKSLLDMQIDTAADSYWIPKEPVKFDKANYEN